MLAAVAVTHAHTTSADLNLGQVLWGNHHQYKSHESASARTEGWLQGKLPKYKVIHLKRVVEMVTKKIPKTKEMTGQSLIMGIIILTAKHNFWGNQFNIF